MKQAPIATQHYIAEITPSSWMHELDKASAKYHLIACWIALVFDPIFVLTDYINIPDSWQHLLIIRLSVSVIILLTLGLKTRLQLSTHAVVSVPFVLISLQNAYTYSLIPAEGLVGHNLNYMALLIGASMFVLWRWTYSLLIVVLSAAATTYFVFTNPEIEFKDFFMKGGLLLITVAFFMMVLIQTRYSLSVKEIKVRLALQLSNEEIQTQAEEIAVINENLEALVRKRTEELEKKNKALEEYAFINAHKLRGPVASILGLIHLLKKEDLQDGSQHIVYRMADEAGKLDHIVGTISRAIAQSEINISRKD